VYLQGSKGVFRALNLMSGREAWKHQFAPTKGPITDGPDVGKLHDTYPVMALTTAREVLYVQDGGGRITAFDPTGNELWSKRISQIQLGQTSAKGLFVFRPVDKGFLVVAADGKVKLWK
jgi:outer membrane protein assembly factor BamB